jgi:4-hydroxy-3-methylbut-2-enyl diphosphate reductase
VRYAREDYSIVLIGHEDHDEVIGTLGEAPDRIVVIDSAAEVEKLDVPNPEKIAYLTQTTLSVDDTREIVAVLQRRFPCIVAPRKNDICYATSNRQEAVKAIAPRADAVLVVGAPNSSNSLRLVEVAKKAGCANALLVQTARDIPWESLANLHSLGLTAGASAPEHLVEEIIAAFREAYDVTVETITTATEDITFKLPRALQSSAA